MPYKIRSGARSGDHSDSSGCVAPHNILLFQRTGMLCVDVSVVQHSGVPCRWHNLQLIATWNASVKNLSTDLGFGDFPPPKRKKIWIVVYACNSVLLVCLHAFLLYFHNSTCFSKRLRVESKWLETWIWMNEYLGTSWRPHLSENRDTLSSHVCPDILSCNLLGYQADDATAQSTLVIWKRSVLCSTQTEHSDVVWMWTTTFQACRRHKFKYY